MKKNVSANILRRLYSSLAVCALLTAIVIGMLLHAQALSLRIAVLENESALMTTKLNSYERTLCPNTQSITQVSQLNKYSIESAGYARSYQVHTPDNYDPSVRYPVIISFDGIEGSGTRMESYSGLDALPAVVVYPDSLPGKQGFTSWQGAPYSLDGEQDVQFVSAILKTLPSQFCVDSTRIFAVGMSNGGSFATIVGCKLGNQIHAVVSVSGAYYTTCRQEQRTPSLLIFHSTTDKQAPFNGSIVRQLPQIPMWVEEEATQRNCKTTIPSTTVELITYSTWLNCSDKSTLNLIVIRDQKHGWLTLPQVSQQTAQGLAGHIWKFFEETTYSN